MATAAIGVGSLIAGGVQRESQAKIERGQAQVAAKGEELAVTAREADRKDRLASALASQNARAGAAGIAAFEGSPLTILQDQIEREQTATQRDKLGSRLGISNLVTTARIRQRQARTRSLISVGQAAGSFAKTGFKPRG